MNMRSGLLLTAALGWSAASSAAAQSTDQSSSSAKRPAADPSQIVCEDITSVGSRLATKRQCMTRGQWAEQRRADREATQELQSGRQNQGCAAAIGDARKGQPAC